MGTPVVAHPLPAAGLAAFAVLATAMTSNALHGQPGRHPHPMMATRGEEAGGEADARAPSTPLVLEMQNALARSGYYAAALDGRLGRGTAAAIKAFQADHGLPADGAPTPLLLARMRQALNEDRPASADPVADRLASLETVADDVALPPADEAVGAIIRGDASARADAVPPAADAALVRRIQSGLAAARIADLHPDGILGARTRDAIRAFEALQGLPVTGEADARIVRRLVKMGALAK